ncbi:hypothetical protein D6817_00365, partial [Candidatus Pacearchaeota archaeon]
DLNEFYEKLHENVVGFDVGKPELEKFLRSKGYDVGVDSVSSRSENLLKVSPLIVPAFLGLLAFIECFDSERDGE